MPFFGRKKKKEQDSAGDLGASSSITVDGPDADADTALEADASTPSSLGVGTLPPLTTIDRGANPSNDEAAAPSTQPTRESSKSSGSGGGSTGGRSGGLFRALTRSADPSPARPYRSVRVNPGGDGWGSGFVVEPSPGRNVVCSMTGGGIHPVAQRIAELTGAPVVDGFGSKVRFDELACAVIDCGGTARIGVYPMKGVLTIDIHAKAPSGPLAQFITEDNFVSGVTPDDVERID